ncbi:Uma2 family endonuclease [Streptomyces triculaminicus]|uniref:Uma2 family endonuclease n=2 Tax=Streptomyces TaxID=1883 RepID=A0A939FNZ4_9ACTN|nr:MULTISPECIES: Uma2 family endonuclease [Streptomyces]MBO0653437.1 Uma2 family endonuclease [Streptomyces triculaminicus]QSY48300.1 Uma2 family endonuclease [Streptomyces griseocarneus]
MTAQSDSLQETIERIAAVLDGFKIEAVGDRIIMTPQSSVQSLTIFDVRDAAVTAGIRKDRVFSDVEFAFPGEPKRCPDLSIVEDEATEKFTYEDLLAAIEVVSSKYDKNDYAIKVRQYARFGVPVYLIIDPFLGECTLLTRPRDDIYARRELYKYGDTIPLRLPDGRAVDIPTDTFKRRT